MPRDREYESNAERQAAYRERKALEKAELLELLPEMERMFTEHAVTGEPQGEIPLAAVPRSFDRGCFDAELHKPGVVCQGCGGSTY